MNTMLTKCFVACVVLTAFSSSSWAAIECRFESLPAGEQREYSSGTITRTARGAIIEFEGSKNVYSATCQETPFRCNAITATSSTDFDFSYDGYMVSISEFPGLGIRAIGLSRIFDCSGNL